MTLTVNVVLRLRYYFIDGNSMYLVEWKESPLRIKDKIVYVYDLYIPMDVTLKQIEEIKNNLEGKYAGSKI